MIDFSYTKGFPNNDTIGTPLSNVVVAFSSVLQVLFWIQTTIPSQRGVSGITISNFGGKPVPQPKYGDFLHPSAVKLKLDK